MSASSAATAHPLFETHAHLQGLQDLPGVMARAQAVGVGRILCVSIDRKTMFEAKALALSHEHVYFSAGVHPHEAQHWTDETEREVREALQHTKGVAVGETGLDYHYNYSDHETQKRVFRKHLEIATQTRKPIIVHCREAAHDVIALLREASPLPAAGVFHCFTENWDVAQAALDIGFYISISGIVTFKNAQPLRDVVAKVPLDRLLIETDTPYLTPVPHRGKPNEPSFVLEVARAVAKVRGMDVDTIARQTWQNAQKLFHIS